MSIIFTPQSYKLADDLTSVNIIGLGRENEKYNIAAKYHPYITVKTSLSSSDLFIHILSLMPIHEARETNSLISELDNMYTISTYNKPLYLNLVRIIKKCSNITILDEDCPHLTKFFIYSRIKPGNSLMAMNLTVKDGKMYASKIKNISYNLNITACFLFIKGSKYKIKINDKIEKHSDFNMIQKLAMEKTICFVYNPDFRVIPKGLKNAIDVQELISRILPGYHVQELNIIMNRTDLKGITLNKIEAICDRLRCVEKCLILQKIWFTTINNILESSSNKLLLDIKHLISMKEYDGLSLPDIKIEYTGLARIDCTKNLLIQHMRKTCENRLIINYFRDYPCNSEIIKTLWQSRMVDLRGESPFLNLDIIYVDFNVLILHKNVKSDKHVELVDVKNGECKFFLPNLSNTGLITLSELHNGKYLRIKIRRDDVKQISRIKNIKDRVLYALRASGYCIKKDIVTISYLPTSGEIGVKLFLD